MARKAKKKGRRPSRPPATAPSATAQRPSDPAGGGPAARVGGDQALVRSVEMSLSPGRVAPGRRGGRIVLESADPAIPLDRVPYFTRDLARLGVVAAVMVALLVGGAQLIPLVVK